MRTLLEFISWKLRKSPEYAFPLFLVFSFWIFVSLFFLMKYAPRDPAQQCGWEFERKPPLCLPRN
jgi:hypothetical protein